MAQKCDPCDCIESYYREEWAWRKAMLLILCDIIDVTGEGCPECPPPAGDEYWVKNLSVLSPATANDSVSLAGDLVFTAANAGVVEAMENIVAAGNDLSDATQVTKRLAVVTGADFAKGVKLPINPVPGAIYSIVNMDHVGELYIYPGQLTDNIFNAAGAGEPVSVYADYTMMLLAVTTTEWVMMSWY